MFYDESESVSTDDHIGLCYYSDDKKKSIYFDQYTADSYSSYYDNERGHFKTSSDKFGNEFMIYTMMISLIFVGLMANIYLV